MEVRGSEQEQKDGIITKNKKKRRGEEKRGEESKAKGGMKR